jgi:ribonuclease HI
MNKLDIIKQLKKMKSFFVDDFEAITEIDSLILKAQNYPDVKVNDPFDESKLLLPEELRDLNQAYAVFADGACRGNPGPGAWAAIIQDASANILLKSSGVDVPTTNNKMELEGVIRGLKGLIEKWVDEGFSDRETPVWVYSDSKYVIEGIDKWVPGWKSRGWRKADNKEPENLVLWQELDDLKSKFNKISFVWVKGHAGHPQNEMCDKMANLALDEAGF